MNRIFLGFGILASLVFSTATTTAESKTATPANAVPLGPVELKIDLKGPAKQFSPIYAGLMTEEINHSYDGGLYAELIRNRVFLENETTPIGWTLSVPTNAAASMMITDSEELTDKLPKSLEVRLDKVGTNNPVTVSNEGYWGIPVKPDTTYKVSFYAKGNNLWNKKNKQTNDPVLFRAPLKVSLQSDDGKTVYATALTPALTSEWQKIILMLKTGQHVVPSKENRFAISADQPGAFYLSLVSLFPPTYKNRTNGNRIDLMEKLAGLQPKFLRFPGGNFLEGDRLADWFNWKQTRGPLEFRPGHAGCWEYRPTDGMGLLEFMGWCEDLGMEPVLAVYAGYSLKKQAIPAGPLLEPYVQDALDEIEYLTGDPKTSYWGALRSKDGHPEPFKLKYVEIGNEDFFDKIPNSYESRFAQFYDAIKSKYPDLQLIATTPVKTRKADIVDDHFYAPVNHFVKDFHHYDNIDRNGPKIFVGEWATVRGRDGDGSHELPTLGMALGDAAWMCAMERNADLIIMQCYAPLLVNMNPQASQWHPNLIGYDALNSVVSPSWHAQQLFNTHRGDEVISTDLKQGANEKPFPYVVTRDKAKALIHIKLINIDPNSREVRISLGDQVQVDPHAETVILHSDDVKSGNSLEKPNAVVPHTGSLKNISANFTVTVPGNSLEIVTLKLKGDK